MQSARLLLAVAVIVLPGAALAHEAPTGWKYHAWCCGGYDCQPIESKQVSITPDGFLVNVPAATHDTASRNHSKLFRYDEVRTSGDGNYHACILPNSQEFRCLYVPQFTY